MLKRILIIDDDANLLKTLNILFKHSKYEAILSKESLDYNQVKEIKPDLILLDINIKGSTKMGDELCKELKSQTETQHLPIILLSGNDNLAFIADDCSANDFIRKPFDIEVLRSKIENNLK